MLPHKFPPRKKRLTCWGNLSGSDLTSAWDADEILALYVKRMLQEMKEKDGFNIENGISIRLEQNTYDDELPPLKPLSVKYGFGE